MSTLTGEDLIVLESLEFEPPCEHSWHERRGATGPAKWAVLFVPILECGCPCASMTLWCEDCKEQVLSRDVVNCNACRAHVNPAASVLRIEPLR